MAQTEVKRTIVWKCIAEIQSHFRAEHGNQYPALQKNTQPLSIQVPFKAVLKRTLETYNDPQADKLGQVQSQIADVKVTMLNNMDELLNRGEKIDTVAQKSETINAQAGKFQKQSKSLATMFWWKDLKLRMMICCIVIVVLYIILGSICNFDFSKCGNDGSNRNNNEDDSKDDSKDDTGNSTASSLLASFRSQHEADTATGSFFDSLRARLARQQ